MRGAELKIALFHRIYLAFLTLSGMAWLGTAVLFARWEMGAAIRCLRGYREKRTPLWERRKAEPKESGEEKTEVLDERAGQKKFRMEREWIGIHSRERIGGEG